LRRQDKEITDKREIEEVLVRASICHLGLCDNGGPYVIPLNYGYADGCLYAHSAQEGRKIDILRKNSLVAFTVYIDDGLRRAETACNWGTKYRSVMGTGHASLIEDQAEKEASLRIIMRHYTETEFEFNPLKIDLVTIIKIKIDKITGKKSV